jgi:hypothetical protein
METEKGNAGIGFLGLLTILFIGLKLTEYIGWSWWWVFSPLIASVGVGIVVLTVSLIVFFKK